MCETRVLEQFVCWSCGDVGLEGSCSSLQGWKSIVGQGCRAAAWTVFGEAQNYSRRMILSKLGFSQSPQINSCRSPGVIICHFLGQSDREEDLDSHRLQISDKS